MRSRRRNTSPIRSRFHFISLPQRIRGMLLRTEIGRRSCPRSRFILISVPGKHQSMMESPYIVSLGEALSQALRQARETRLPHPEIDYCPILSIRDGQRGATPVLCVPGAGDTAISFLDLADNLGTLGPIEALQPRGLDGTLVPHATVHAAARLYLQCIEQKYRRQSVHFVGHSFGGWIAFEMAQLLAPPDALWRR